MNAHPASDGPMPGWPPGTVIVLATHADGPFAIPVSAAVRVGPKLMLLALASGRGSLTRIRADPSVSVLVLAGDDVAFSAHGRASVADEALVAGVAAVRVDVDRVVDHSRPTFTVDAAVGWHWTDPAAQARDAEVRAALDRLASRIG